MRLRLVRPIVLAACMAVAAAPVAHAATCSPSHQTETERAATRADLLETLANAPTEAAGRAAEEAMWQFWANAPDAKAQGLLDQAYDLRRWHDLEASEALLRELTAYCPDYPEGWNQLAAVLFQRQKFDASLDVIIRVLELEPAHFGALAGRAVILVRQGRVGLAYNALNDAVAIHPWLRERDLLPPLPEQEL